MDFRFRVSQLPKRNNLPFLSPDLWRANKKTLKRQTVVKCIKARGFHLHDCLTELWRHTVLRASGETLPRAVQSTQHTPTSDSHSREPPDLTFLEMTVLSQTSHSCGFLEFPVAVKFHTLAAR